MGINSVTLEISRDRKNSQGFGNTYAYCLPTPLLALIRAVGLMGRFEYDAAADIKELW
uniref:Uncharacterized protein n=1 Tax=Candidatus Kentrum sp. TUN TaxID=2126343 RepID=A0A450ZKC7_9GAMM|nr:MAG: hypothetical protein BECKTUN1418D_GA0071000_10214 [Candidatus Kentron sp. TUN]